MKVSAYLDYLKETDKKFANIIDRFNLVADMFFPAAVKACFEVSPEISVEDIIAGNHEIIYQAIVKIQNFRDFISEVIEVIKAKFSENLEVIGLSTQPIDESILYAEEGIQSLENQTQILKDYIENNPEILEKKNEGFEDFDYLASKYLN